MTWAALSFALGIAIGWRASRYAIGKRQAARRELSELMLELRNPLDLQPTYSPFSGEVWS